MNNSEHFLTVETSFGRDQTCAMLLALASGNTFLAPEQPTGLGKLLTVSPEVAAVAKQAFYDFGERPTWTERVTYGTSEFLIMGSAFSTLTTCSDR